MSNDMLLVVRIATLCACRAMLTLSGASPATD